MGIMGNFNLRSVPWNWGISSLGCPHLKLFELVDLAHRFGFKTIELRVLESEMDLPGYFQGHELSPSKVKSLLAQKGISIQVLDTSLRLINPKSEDLEDFIRFAKLAESLGIPYLRAFDGGEDCTLASLDQIKSAAATLNWWDRLKAENNWNVDLLMETHWSFITPQSCLRLADFREGKLSLIWDSFHTWRKSKISPSEVWSSISDYVKHVHFKDAIKDSRIPKGALHKTLGQGEFPLSDLFDSLNKDDFRGSVCLEWETFWKPDLEPLEVQLTEGKRLGYW